MNRLKTLFGITGDFLFLCRTQEALRKKSGKCSRLYQQDLNRI